MLRNVKVRPLKKAPACEERERGGDRGLKQNFFYNLYEPNHVLVLADWLSQGQKSGAIRLLDYHQQNGLLLQNWLLLLPGEESQKFMLILVPGQGNPRK